MSRLRSKEKGTSRPTMRKWSYSDRSHLLVRHPGDHGRISWTILVTSILHMWYLIMVDFRFQLTRTCSPNNHQRSGIFHILIRGSRRGLDKMRTWLSRVNHRCCKWPLNVFSTFVRHVVQTREIIVHRVSDKTPNLLNTNHFTNLNTDRVSTKGLCDTFKNLLTSLGLGISRNGGSKESMGYRLDSPLGKGVKSFIYAPRLV